MILPIEFHEGPQKDHQNALIGWHRTRQLVQSPSEFDFNEDQLKRAKPLAPEQVYTLALEPVAEG